MGELLNDYGIVFFSAMMITPNLRGVDPSIVFNGNAPNSFVRIVHFSITANLIPCSLMSEC